MSFLKDFSMGKYKVQFFRMLNLGFKSPKHISKWSYYFSVMEVKKKGKRYEIKDVLKNFEVPANDIYSAKYGLRGALETRKLIPKRPKGKTQWYKSKEGILKTKKHRKGLFD